MRPTASSLLPMTAKFSLAALLVPLAVRQPAAVAADDSVTISRSRLEELERKEAELNKLKAGPANAGQQQNPAAAVLSGASVAPTNAVTRAPRPAPAVFESLPPLKPDEVVSVDDLAAHYLANPAAADGRYRKRKFLLDGEIASFDKPVLGRSYKILLKAQGPRVVCDFYPPEKYSMIFPAKHGAELVATLGQDRSNQVTLARVGQKVVVEVHCSGGDPAEIKLTHCTIKSARDPVAR